MASNDELTGPQDRGQAAGPLAGIRVIESSMLGPGAITTHLADLGADVIKVESPSGDYIRQMSWPIIEGDSLLHLHISRGKRSIVLDLKQPEGIEVYKQLVAGADVVVEAMRAGALERLGLGYDVLRSVNPAIVFCTISGYGATGPYKSLPSHGIAYDTWAGLVKPEYDDEGYPYIPEHPSVGIHAGPIFGAFGILAGVVQAQRTGEGCQIEIAQSDAAAAMDWLRSETWKAYERPESEVTGNPADDYERRAPGTAGMRGGVRYQIYESADGHIIFMSSEQAFWRNFCVAVDRPRAVRAVAGKHLRRPRARQPRAASHPRRHLSNSLHRRLGHLRRRAQRADRPGPHAGDHRGGPAVQGTARLPARQRPRRRPSPHADQGRRHRAATRPGRHPRSASTPPRCSATCSARPTTRSPRCATPASRADEPPGV